MGDGENNSGKVASGPIQEGWAPLGSFKPVSGTQAPWSLGAFPHFIQGPFPRSTKTLQTFLDPRELPAGGKPMALKAPAHPGRGELCKEMLAFKARQWEEVLGGGRGRLGRALWEHSQDSLL